VVLKDLVIFAMNLALICSKFLKATADGLWTAKRAGKTAKTIAKERVAIMVFETDFNLINKISKM
jgi:hypothetical protein